MIDHSQIKFALNRILNSEALRDSERIRRFLAYVVNEKLEGRETNIKAYNIAVDVFNKSESFDPQSSSLVRTYGGKLRDSLELYYLTEGKDDRVLIRIPKGAYIPEFINREEPENAEKVHIANEPPRIRQKIWFGAAIGVVLTAVLILALKERNQSIAHIDPLKPGIAIVSSLNGSGNSESQFVSVIDQLSTEFASYQEFRIIGPNFIKPSTLSADFYRSNGVNFLFNLELNLTDAQQKITIKLIDPLKNQIEWSQVYTIDPDEEFVFEKLKSDLSEMVYQLANTYGVINQILSRGADDTRVNDVQDYQLTSYFHHYANNFSSERYEKMVRLTNRFLKKYPKSGIVNSLRAVLYIDQYVLYGKDSISATPLAEKYIRKAIKLDPYSEMVQNRAIVVFYNLRLFDEMKKAVEMLHAINPNSNSLGEAGIHLYLIGQEEKGIAILDEAMNNMLHFPDYYNGIFAVEQLRHGNWIEARSEALKIQTPEVFYDPLLKFITAYKTDKPIKANEAFQLLTKYYPDFTDQPETYIKRLFYADEQHQLLIGLYHEALLYLKDNSNKGPILVLSSS